MASPQRKPAASRASKSTESAKSSSDNILETIGKEAGTKMAAAPEGNTKPHSKNMCTGKMNAVMKRLAESPDAPPLSVPIPFLEGKLSNVKLYYQQVPEGFTDWKTNSSVSAAFPAPKGFPANHVPQALLQDAKTDLDKLIVISWWRFLPKEEHRPMFEALKKIYAQPRVDNRLLPPDFWEKMRKLDERRTLAGKIKALDPPPDPSGNDYYVHPRDKDGKPILKSKPRKKDTSCRGWKGEAYDKLFQACYMEAMKGVTMKGGATKVPDMIPLTESIARTTRFKDICFVREGDDYVLRSVGCTKERRQDMRTNFCSSCHAVINVVGQANRNVVPFDKVDAQQKDQIASLKSDLKSALRREKRLREKLGMHPRGGVKGTASGGAASANAASLGDGSEDPSSKRPRTSTSPRRLAMVAPNPNLFYGGYGAGEGYP